jgi:hypothetical protein
VCTGQTAPELHKHAHVRVTDAALGSVLEAGSVHVMTVLLPTPETTKFDIKAHDHSISCMRKKEPNTN